MDLKSDSPEAQRAANCLDMQAAMRQFVDRCDRGEIRSVRTYARFKELLARASEIEARTDALERSSEIALERSSEIASVGERGSAKERWSESPKAADLPSWAYSF